MLGILRILAVAALMAAWASPAGAAREVTVFVRVDDVFMLRTDKDPMEIGHFLSVAEKHDGRVILAVVPNRLLQKPNEGGAMTRALLDAAARGHQIAQHGFDHMCPFTGDTGREYATSASLERLTQDQRMERLMEGRRLLQAVTGEPATTFVYPGGDGDVLLPIDTERLWAEGFTWVRSRDVEFTKLTDGKGLFPYIYDYTWVMTEDDYAERMQRAKDSFLDVTSRGDEWGVCFHDHFTRKAYNDGIVLRWFDELLGWIRSRPGMTVRIETLDQFTERTARKAD